MHDLNRVVNMEALYRAWQKTSIKGNSPGLDGVSIELYRSDLQKNLRTLQTAIVCRIYRPYTEKIYHHQDRSICVHSVDDKIVQTLIAEVIMSAYRPAKSVHGFINKRSVFTAKKALDNALKNGVSEYSKVDIKRFYDSVDNRMMLNKVATVFDDPGLLELIELLIYAHSPGLSTGSCLSPALSNLFLADFDRSIEANSVFYARYVDDMLVAPVSNIKLIEEKLAEEGLEINQDKSKPVHAGEGFRYLGFDIKCCVEEAIVKGDYVAAEQVYETQECDVGLSEPPAPAKPAQPDPKPEYAMPNTLRNVVRKCYIIREIVEKAEAEHYLGFPEKTCLLQVFHCLGKDGADFIHHVLTSCADYDYAETQRRINKYGVNNPLGCKKLGERLGDGSRCLCNFSNEKVYPTPIIHALRVDSNCFKLTAPKDNIGHFKAKNPKDKATDALSAIIQLNMKQYEISEQQKILKGQIEDLFERTNTQELLTPQGLLIKNEDGIFIKVG